MQIIISKQVRKREMELWLEIRKCHQIGDVVLKEKQKDLSRKGGKMNTRFFKLTYSVVDIMNNGNCVDVKKNNDILSTSCPMKHIKNIYNETLMRKWMW